MAVDRRALWLGAFLIVAVGGVMAVRSGNEPAPAPGIRAAPARAGAQPDAPVAPADVKLEALATVRDEPTDLGRNPFRFQARPVATPEVRRLPGIPDDQVDAPPVAKVPAGPPPPPPIALKFIGLVQKADGTKFAVLSDGKGPPISGREGEEIEGRYKILKIGTESIEIAYIDGRGRRTIPLTGQ
ncbi:MAG TPA: hypothetical protein VMO26_30250 [Vicinamibacterales bacterium]|nr:hypothetical protein [Vicinamibacterales bacterium]